MDQESAINVYTIFFNFVILWTNNTYSCRIINTGLSGVTCLFLRPPMLMAVMVLLIVCISLTLSWIILGTDLRDITFTTANSSSAAKINVMQVTFHTSIA